MATNSRLLSFAILLCFLHHFRPIFANVRVELSEEAIQGETIELLDPERTKVHQFLSIPYASAKRFQRPLDATEWEEQVFDATKPGKPCWQKMNRETLLKFPKTVPTAFSEDCLLLNVWTTSIDQSSLVPVLVYIHGGNFQQGSSSYLNGSLMAAHGKIVVVSMQYRVGLFGFVALAEPEWHSNLGLWDQVAAMKWIQNNIHLFGGDPKHVTLIGDEAGGLSILHHVCSEVSRNLFRRAILVSFPATPPQTANPNVIHSTEMLFQRLNCSSMSCLEAKDPQSFLDAMLPEFNFHPIVDGQLLTKSISECYEQRHFHRAGLMLISVNGAGMEAALQTVTGFQSGLDTGRAGARQTLRTLVRKFVPSKQQAAVLRKIAHKYLPSNSDHEKGLLALLGDWFVHAPAFDILRKHAADSVAYHLVLDHSSSISSVPASFGVGREVALFLIFGQALLPDYSAAVHPEEQALSKMLMSYVANFVKSGDPNEEGLKLCPSFSPKTGHALLFNPNPHAALNYKSELIDFWLKEIADHLADKDQPDTDQSPPTSKKDSNKDEL